MRKQAPRHAGQSIVEYALILSVVAIVALPSFVLLRDTQAGFFNAHADNLNAPSMYTEPKGLADCHGTAWKSYYTQYGYFHDADQCKDYVLTGSIDSHGGDKEKDWGSKGKDD
jgi:Flp pilus assembly pilin Flp